jgi:hypothetical protein
VRYAAKFWVSAILKFLSIKPICIEDNDYNEIGYVSILNAHGNLDCKRQRPEAITKNTKTTESFAQMIKQQQRDNLSLEDE